MTADRRSLLDNSLYILFERTRGKSGERSEEGKQR